MLVTARCNSDETEMFDRNTGITKFKNGQISDWSPTIGVECLLKDVLGIEVNTSVSEATGFDDI